VCTIPTRGTRGFHSRGFASQRDNGRCFGLECGEFVGRFSSRGQYKFGRNDHNFESQRNYGQCSPLVVLVLL
jgi:hypothetical protein